MQTYLRHTLLALALSGLCFANPAPSDGEAPAKKVHGKKKPVAVKAVTQDEFKQLKDAFAVQQQQIDSLKQENANLAQELKQSQQQAQSAQSTASDAQQKVSALESEEKPAVIKLQSDVAEVKTTAANTAATLQKDEKRVGDLEVPAYVHYKGVKLTPGGYVQFATIDRTRNANADTADQYGSYPFANSPNYYMKEFRASGRASRLSLKMEGEAKGMKFMSYIESDFLGNAGGTENQTNSFAPRLRLAFANVDLPGGWSIAGGQNWSLIQTTRKGINPLSEWLPSVIDNSYVPGFSYARQGSIRVVKQIIPKAWLGVALENPDTGVTTAACTGNTGSTGPTAATSNLSACSFTAGQIMGLDNSTNTTSPNNGYLNALSGANAITGNPSTNRIPDLVAKLAFEPGWGHFEVKAIARFFSDRVYPNYLSGQTTSTTSVTGTKTVGGVTTPVTVTTATTTFSNSTVGATNRTTEGGGFGFGAVLPVVKNKVDVEFQGLAGAGIGRFGTTAGPDVTISPFNGALVPVKGVQVIAGIETHPTPKFDFNIYAGGDYYKRVSYTLPANFNFFGATVATAGAQAGYGNQDLNDKGCSIEGGTCSGVTKSILSGTAQMWYRIYKGKAGTVQFGTSYSYVHKDAWPGLSATSSTTNLNAITNLVSPKTINQIVMTSFRYYIP
jgi:hypothetical protein